MADFTITPDGGSAITFSLLTTAATGTAGKYWILLPRARTPKYPIQQIKASNTSGLGVSRSGWSGLDLDNIEVMYINTSASGILSAWNTDRNNMMNIINGCVLSLPDYPATLPCCECIQNEQKIFRDGRIIKPTGASAMYRMHVLMGFLQLRTS